LGAEAEVNNMMNREIALMSDLVSRGKLPGSVLPRLCYFGHTHICGIKMPPEYICIHCKHQWTDKTQKDCPNCQSLDVYDVSDKTQGEWECVACHQRWVSNNGYVCPYCGKEKDVPRWSCKKCDHKWQQVGIPDICPNCNCNLEYK
jgi:hypothetical protein